MHTYPRHQHPLSQGKGSAGTSGPASGQCCGTHGQCLSCPSCTQAKAREPHNTGAARARGHAAFTVHVHADPTCCARKSWPARTHVTNTSTRGFVRRCGEKRACAQLTIVEDMGTGVVSSGVGGAKAALRRTCLPLRTACMAMSNAVSFMICKRFMALVSVKPMKVC
jgi:hypothetical protein